MRCLRLGNRACGYFGYSKLQYKNDHLFDYCTTKYFQSDIVDKTSVKKKCLKPFRGTLSPEPARFSFMYNLRFQNRSAPFPLAYHHIPPGMPVPRLAIPQSMQERLRCHTELVF